jgi:hypothetical protein
MGHSKRQLHPLLEQQLRECITDPSRRSLAGCIGVLCTQPGLLLGLLESVDCAYREHDLFLERTLAALDRSGEEAREAQRQESARVRRLEAELAGGGRP